MFRYFTEGWRVAVGLLLGGLAAAAAPATNLPLRVTATLSDGSKLIGEPALKALPLRTDYTRLELPLDKITTLKFSPQTNTVALALANGDKLSATLDLAELRLTTLVGKVSLPLKLLTALTVNPGGAAAAVAPEGLVLWYRFEGAQGADLADASGREHTGKLFHGARVVSDEGRRREVLELDGRGAHVRVPGSPDFAVTNATLIVWLKPAQWSFSSGNVPTVLSSLTPNGSAGGIQFHLGGNRTCAWVGCLANQDRNFSSDFELPVFTENEWHCLAVTCNLQGAQYRVTFFLDGQPAKEGDHTVSGGLGYSGQPFYIGINYDSPAAEQGRNYRREYGGRMDDLMLFNRALSADEIAALYQQQR